MQWEYKTIRFEKRSFWSSRINIEEIERKLNERGLTGWELVSTASIGVFSAPVVLAFLKRPRTA